MVARAGHFRTAFTSGELTDELQMQTGLKAYWSGLARAENIDPLPQGGFRLSPRSRLVGLRRGALQAVALLGEATATVAAAGDVLVLDMGVTAAISAVDLNGVSLSLPAGPALALDALDATTGVWTAIGGGAFAPARAPALTSRRLARPPRASVTARYLRVRLTATLSGAATLSIASVSAFAEVAAIDPALRPHAMTTRDGLSYVFDMQPGHVDVYRGGVFVGAAAHSLTASALREAAVFGRDETVFILHQDHPPQRLLRHAVDWDWSVEALVFANIPQVQFDGAYTDTPEVWRLSLRWPSSASALSILFTVTVDGAATDTIGVASSGGAPDWDATAAAIDAALEELGTVGASNVTVTHSYAETGYAEFLVTFDGEAAGSNFLVSAAIANTADASATMLRVSKGALGGEPIMSAVRGWPGAGCFHQQRLVLGGFRTEPAALLASRPGEFFDFNIEAASASAAILLRLDVEAGERINGLFSGRHLVAITNQALFFAPDRVISATAANVFVRSDAAAVSRGVAPVAQEDSFLLVNADGSKLLSARYDDVSQGYSTTPISEMSVNLVRGVVGLTLKRAAGDVSADRLFMPRADGMLVVAHLLRSQEIVAYTRWTTDGRVIGAICDGDGAVYLFVVRQTGGTVATSIERLEDGLALDMAVTVDVGVETQTVGGLGLHDGRPIWIENGGFYEGPLTPVGGVVTTSWPVAGIVTAGRWSPPVARTLPLVNQPADRVVVARPGRVHAVRMNLMATSSIAVGANGLPPAEAALQRFAAQVDAPPPAFTGRFDVEGLLGFTDAPSVVFTQLRPGSLHLRDAVIEARI